MSALKKRVLICPDTFKGTLSSLGVTRTVGDVLLSSSSSNRPSPFNVDLAPMSDGGAGLLDSLLNGCQGLKSVSLSNIVGPCGLDHRLPTRFAVHPEQRYAVVEMAEASGLPLVEERLRAGAKMGGGSSGKDPRYTTSYGTGEVMAHIASAYSPAEVRTVYVGIGGSSTNDCGFGALQALGMDIYVKGGEGEKEELLQTPFMGKDLARVVRIDTNTPRFRAFCSRFPGEAIVLLCDVSNPLLGPHGATHIYGPQKGATSPAVLAELEAGMANVAAVIDRHLGTKGVCVAEGGVCSSPQRIMNVGGAKAGGGGVGVGSGEHEGAGIGAMKGAGGAGGMSGGFFALLNARWQAGAEVLQDVFLRLDERIAAADIIITGEGRFDQQTIQYGKTVASLYKALLKGLEDEKEKKRTSPTTMTTTNKKKKLFVVVCGLYQGPPIEPNGHIPSLCTAGVDVYAFALSPQRFPSTLAMTETQACLQKMTEKDIRPFLEAFANPHPHL